MEEYRNVLTRSGVDQVSFEEGMVKTIDWYIENSHWVDTVSQKMKEN